MKGVKTLPSLERVARIHRKRVSIENAILSALAAGGILSFGLMAPNALELLKKFDTDWISKRDPRQRLHETMYRLKKKGLVEFRDVNGKQSLYLTTKGRKMSQKIQLGSLQIKKPRRWDERWRIVMFDIDEGKRSLRQKVRRWMRELGFKRLQDSVWIHPYDCEEIITLLKTDLRIGKELLYVIADAVEYDRPLREYFKLPLR